MNCNNCYLLRWAGLLDILMMDRSSPQVDIEELAWSAATVATAAVAAVAAVTRTTWSSWGKAGKGSRTCCTCSSPSDSEEDKSQSFCNCNWVVTAATPATSASATPPTSDGSSLTFECWDECEMQLRVNRSELIEKFTQWIGWELQVAWEADGWYKPEEGGECGLQGSRARSSSGRT